MKHVNILYHKNKKDKFTEFQAFRVTKREQELIEKMAKQLDCSNSEIWRSILRTISVLYDADLKLKDAIKSDIMKNKSAFKKMSEKPLYSSLKSIPWLENWVKAVRVKK